MQQRMQKAHDYLSNNMAWYKEWHEKPSHSTFHWVVFLMVTALLSISTLSLTDQIARNLANADSLNQSRPDPVVAKGSVVGRASDHIIVKFKSGTTTAKKNALYSKRKIKQRSQLTTTGTEVVDLPEGTTPEQMVAQLNSSENDTVEYAEVDEIASPTFIPNDPNFSSQWPHPILKTTTAWDSITPTGIGSIIIGIADTGVDCTHPDLAAKCVPGWNFYDNNSNAADNWGHGTKVAGSAAAAGNNSIGIAGVAWGAKIMPLRISGPDGLAYTSTTVAAIRWAVDNGAKVVNNSFGFTRSSQTWIDLANYVKSKGAMLVVSEGNGGTNTNETDNAGIISVGGLTGSDTLYSWSSYGPNVDVVAPGCVGSTTLNGGGYGDGCGTSYASPMTAGVLALIFAANPALTPDQAKQILFSSASDLGPAGYDITYGWGKVDAAAAVAAALGGQVVVPPPPVTDTTAPSVPTNLNSTLTSDNKAQLTWTASTDNTAVAGYKLYKNGALYQTLTTTTYKDMSVSSGTSYSYTVSAYDAIGNASAQSSSTSITIPVSSDSVAPSTPTNLSAVAALTQVALNWGASTDNVAVVGYKLYRNGTLLHSLGTAATTFTDTNVTAGTTYSYAVAGYDSAGNVSGNSNNATATVPSNAPADSSAPSTPFNLTGSSPDSKQVNLSWTASTDNVAVTGYKIYRNSALLKSVTSTSASDTSVTQGTSYSYAVSAYDTANNESAKSSTITVFIVAPVTINITSNDASSITANSATINWGTNITSTGFTSFGTNRNHLSQSVNDAAISLQHTVKLIGLRANTVYYYKITANSADGTDRTTTTVYSFKTGAAATTK